MIQAFDKIVKDGQFLQQLLQMELAALLTTVFGLISAIALKYFITISRLRLMVCNEIKMLLYH